CTRCAPGRSYGSSPRFIVGPCPPPTIRPVAGSPTQRSGGPLLRNPYPALPDASRNGFELGVHLQLREDVLDVRPDGVRRHGQPPPDHLFVVSQRQLAEHGQLSRGQRRRRAWIILLLQA